MAYTLTDLQHLELGDTINTIQCECMLDCSSTEIVFGLHLLKLKQDVEKVLRAKFGRTITVRVQQQALQVLTDREAAQYNPKRFADGLRIARTSHRRLMAVNRQALTPRERDEIDSTICRQAAMLSMMRAPRQSAEPAQLPKLPSLATSHKQPSK